MNKNDFQICYDLLDAKSDRTEAEEKTYKKLGLILQQITIQEDTQEAMNHIREEMQALEN